MNIIWSERAWNDFQNILENNERKIVKKIFKYIDDIKRNGVDKGLGKPEPLKYDLSGYWSRELSGEDRLVYKISDDTLYIISCKTHYHKN